MTSRGVLFVGNFLSSGQHQTYCEELSDRVEARGWRVARTSRRRDRVSRLADMVACTWAARKDYELAHVDVFSGAAFVWAEAVCFVLRRLGKPYVVTLRGGNLPAFARQWPRRVRRLLGSARAVTAPSTFLRTELSPYAAAIREVPNAVDTSRYPFTLRRVPGPRLVWLRAFHHVYNPVMAVDVLARLGDPAATLTMVGADKGDGALEAVRARARELGVEERVEIVPGVPKAEVPRYLAAGDIFLNTTDVDNTPVSVIEAMACGLCVVSTNVGGIPHLLSHEQDALLVPPRDPDAMTVAVRRVLEDQLLAARLSRGGREHAERVDWSAVLDRWEQLFAEVARG